MKTSLIVSRRQVLRGAGGLTLGLPFLPSLLPGPAYGADPMPVRRPMFIAFSTEHGAVQQRSFAPNEGTLDRVTALAPGHDVRWGTLRPELGGGTTALSPVLKASSAKLTARLVGKMNYLRGFDVVHHLGHHTGGHLGNFNAQVGGGISPATPTIDQVMAWSPSFYPTLAGVRERAITTGQNFNGISWNYANPGAKSGGIQKVGVEGSAHAIFDRLFGTGMAANMGPKRGPIIDRIKMNYQRLVQSNRRLSREDRLRLEAHVARLDELERRLNASAVIDCGKPVRPAEDSTRFDTGNPRDADAKFFHLIHDVLVAGMSCGLTRVASVAIIATLHDYAGNWHQDIAHRHNEARAQQILIESHQATFERVIVDFAAKMDAVETAPGRTLLDDALVQWTMEAGPETHNAKHLPVVTFGSAGGFFKTGLYVDYRNRKSTPKVYGEFFGVQHRQWLANALLAMGVGANEYQSPAPGYGAFRDDAEYRAAVVPAIYTAAGDKRPVIT